MLYTPENHEPLTEAEWNAGRVRERIAEIVAATDLSATESPTTLYSGASGVIWALHRLGSGADFGTETLGALERWREQPDFPERAEPPIRGHASLFFGETGPLYVAWLLTSEAKLADDLYARVRENVEAPANELMWASVGTTLVAKRMFDRTGDERWGEIWKEGADVLWERRDEDGLWETLPFGRGLGAAHGASTTAKVLLEGDLLEDSRREQLASETAAALARYAVREDGFANWPLVADDEVLEYEGEIRLQWCHGGAGVIASAAGYLEEELLLAAAELCWRAGPASLDKGSGLCHGTAGTGYAFLKTFERTGDERWLERARRFAVHALEQVERLPARHALWTGGIGAALFAADCLEARPEVPVLDVF